VFIEFTRTYRNLRNTRQMLLNVHTIQTVEDCNDEGIPGINTRIILDRKNENNENVIIYSEELYSQIAFRIKSIFVPPAPRKVRPKVKRKPKEKA
jgi:hypothetical protein